MQRLVIQTRACLRKAGKLTSCKTWQPARVHALMPASPQARNTATERKGYSKGMQEKTLNITPFSHFSHSFHTVSHPPGHHGLGQDDLLHHLGG